MPSHTHKYVRIKVGKNKRIEYKCALPGCPHRIREEYASGRISLCNRCNNEFILDKENMRLAKPHCFSCTNSKVKQLAPKIVEILELIEQGDE